MLRRAPRSTLSPYTTLFRSWRRSVTGRLHSTDRGKRAFLVAYADYQLLASSIRGRGALGCTLPQPQIGLPEAPGHPRSEEHTSELQSQSNLVCRLLLEKKNN